MSSLCLLYLASRFPLRFRRLLSRRLRRVALECAGRGKLAEFMTHHVFRHIDRYKLPPVMHADRMPDELGQDGRTARPGPHNFLFVRRIQRVDSFFEVSIDKRSLAYRTPHLLFASPVHDEFVGALVVARLVAARRLAPRRHRMASARGLAFAATVRVIDRVHRNAAVMRALAHPALAAGFTQG